MKRGMLWVSLLVMVLFASLSQAQQIIDPSIAWKFEFDWNIGTGIAAGSFELKCGTVDGTYTFNSATLSSSGLTSPYTIPFTSMDVPFANNTTYYCAVRAKAVSPDTDVSEYSPSISFRFQPATGLIAHWKLDENSGSTAADASGNGRTGTLFGNAGWSSTGKSAGSLLLDGTGDYVKVTGMLGNFPTMTVTGWVNNTGLDSNGAQVFNIGGVFHIMLKSGDEVQAAAQYDASNWLVLSTTAVPVVNQGWHHLAFVYDDANNIQKLFIDGVVRDSDTVSSGVYYTDGDGFTYIGTNADVSGTEDFTGKIDDVRVYGRPLMDSEVLALYQGGLPQKPSAPRIKP